MRVAPVSVACEPRLLELTAGHYVCISVRDTGTGMDEATVARIFEPFFTTKAEGKGTGLGLATVHGIVRNHGGAVQVESALGAGTEFKVYFPAITADGQEVLEGRESMHQGRLEHILLVDDEEVIVKLCVKMLTENGYRVTHRTHPEEALRVFSADPHAFDLLITDLTMPGMTGAELARRVLAQRPGFPVILITGMDEATQTAKTRHVDIGEALSKPLDLLTLAKTIRRLLDTPAK